MKLFFALLILVCFAANNAAADELRSTRGQGLIEKSHHVDAHIKDGIATLRVRRSFYNPGTLHEQAELTLHLPRGAAATGLRIKAGNKWYEGELMEARKAAALYEKLIGIGPYAARDPALLSWSWVDELFLSLFPIAPKRTSFVEYTLTMPTEYFEGNYLFSYPRAGKKKTKEQLAQGQNELAIPTIRVRGQRGVRIDGKRASGKSKLKDAKRAALLEKFDYAEGFRYAVLPLKIRDNFKTENAELKIDIDHTWSGDVAIDLISPEGEILSIDKGDWQGEDENKKTIKERLGIDVLSKGVWHLVAWDTYPNIDSGQITRWSISQGKGKKRRKYAFRKPTPVPNSANLAVAQISVPAKISDRVDFRYAKVDLIKDKHFLSYELNLAKKISKLPNNLYLSLLLDSSHSIDPFQLESARLLIREILRYVPNAKVDFILFDREARLYGGKRWRAKTLHRALKKMPVVQRNGSHLDKAISFAQKRTKDHRGAHEMILLTDAKMRPNWDTPSLAKKLKKGKGVLHVLELSGRQQSFDRRDDLSLFPLAKSRGGVAMEVGPLEEFRRSLLKEKALYLLRPTLVENIKVNNEDIEALKEGSGRRAYFFKKKSPDTFSFYGELWSTPIQREVEANALNSKALGAFVFSLDRFNALSRDEQLRLAMFANVVSPMTSFLAVEPGVRPSVVGLGRSGTGSGMGFSGKGRSGSGRIRAKEVDLLKLLQPAMAKCAHLVKGEERLFIDLTDHEIVDLRPAKVKSPKAMQCLVDAIWSVNLPKAAKWPERQTRELIVPF